MDASEKAIIDFTIRSAYALFGIGRDLKLTLSQFLQFRFSAAMPVQQFQHIESKAASKQFRNFNECAEEAASLSEEEKIEVLGNWQFIQGLAKAQGDRTLSQKINRLSNQLIERSELENKRDQINLKCLKATQAFNQHVNRPIIYIPVKIWPLTLDYTIRCVALLVIGILGASQDSLYFINILVITPFVIALIVYNRKGDKSANQQLLESQGGLPHYHLKYFVSSTQYTVLAFYFLSSILISYLIAIELFLIAIVGLVLYYLIYLNFYRVGRLHENDLLAQLDHQEKPTQLLNEDENDEVIVKLETQLTSYTSRLEAYVLESALFGALTFSGFLQIMAADFISFPDLENFARLLLEAGQNLVRFNEAGLASSLAGLNNKVSLFCLVSVESLLCSIFFLGVIAARLRFSNIADQVTTSLNIAKAFNSKEEGIIERRSDEKSSTRLHKITLTINEQLNLATLALEQVKPVMAYMQYFRNVGILLFLFILISSSLFIGGGLSWLFIALVVATYIYFNKVGIDQRFQSFLFQFRISFTSKNYWFLLMAFSPFLLAFFGRIVFHIRETSWLLTLGYLMMALYLFAWLTMSAHLDERFGEIDTTRESFFKKSRWKFLKNLLASLFLFGGIAFVMKQQRLPGSNEIMILSLGFSAILMYVVGYYLSKVRWLGILSGLGLATAFMGILFVKEQWEGADEFFWLGISIGLVFIILILVWKRLFHFLLLRFYLVSFGISLFMLFGFPTTLMYEHETFSYSQLSDVVNKNSYESLSQGDDAVQEGLRESDEYIKEYGTSFGYTEVYLSFSMGYAIFVDNSIRKFKADQDSSSLVLALKVAQQSTKIEKMFNYQFGPFFGTEPDLLLAMGKKEEAVKMLKNIVLLTNDQAAIKEYCEGRIKQIKSGN